MIGFFLSAAILIGAPDCSDSEMMPLPSEWLMGEGDADWCLTGVDPFALAGPDLQPPKQLVARDEEQNAVQILQWRRTGPGPVPSAWRMVFKLPPKTFGASDFREILIQRLGDHLLVVTSNPAWRIGNAICVGEGGPSTGYVPAGVTPSEADRALIDTMNTGFSDINPANVMCTQFTREGDGYTASFHGPQGRPLPEIDGYYAATRFHVTVAGNLEALLGVSR